MSVAESWDARPPGLSPWARKRRWPRDHLLCGLSRNCVGGGSSAAGHVFHGRVAAPRSRLTLVRVAAEPGSDGGPFALINSWMSHPVNDRSRVLRAPPAANEQEHYYATELFSCLVREERFDGIQFSSSVRKNGGNYAFFDPYLMDITDTRLIQV